MTTWCMRIACWIPKITNVYSEYVIPTAYPLQQWVHDRASMLRHTYIATCLVAELTFYRREPGTFLMGYYRP